MHLRYTAFCVSCVWIMVPLMLSMTLMAQSLKKPMISEEKQELLKKRDRLYEESKKLYFQQGKHFQAIAKLREVLDVEKQIYGELHSKILSRLQAIAYFSELTENWNAAQKALEEIKVFYSRKEGEHHWKTQDAQRSLDDVVLRRKLTPKQRHSLKQATQASEKAVQLYRAGRSREAVVLTKQSLEIRGKILGEKHPDYINALALLAEAFRAQGEYSKALPIAQQTVALCKEVLGEQHPIYVSALSNLALLWKTQGEYAKAFPLNQQALALVKKVSGENDPDYATSLNNLAAVYMSAKYYNKALPLYQKSLTITKQSVGEKHLQYAITLNNLAVLHKSQGQYDKAHTYYQLARTRIKQLLGEQHPTYATVLNGLAGIYKSQGKYDKAISLCQQSLVLTTEMLGDNHPGYVRSLKNLASVHYYRGNYSLAEKYFRQASEAFLRHRLLVSQDSLQRASRVAVDAPMSSLVALLARNKKPKAAWDWLEQSLGRATWDAITSRNHRTTQEQQAISELQSQIQQSTQLLKKLASQLVLSKKEKALQQRLLAEQGKLYSKMAALCNKLEEKYGVTEGKSYSLSEIQSSLADDAAFLAWIDTKNEHWVVLVRSKGVPVFQRVKANGNVWTKLDDTRPIRLYTLLTSREGIRSDERESLLRKLRQQRIEPILKYLKDIDHLIILPSPAMDLLPVELLLPDKTVSRAPSATVYTYLQRLARPESKRLLALGDPIFNPQEELKEMPLPESGILITSVVVNSLGEKAGLKTDQILLEYAGIALNNLDDLRKAMTSVQGKKEVRLKIWEAGNTFEKIIPIGNLGVVLSRASAKVALRHRRKQRWELASRGKEFNALPGTRIEVTSIAKLWNKNQRQVLLDSSASEQQLHQLASTDKLKEYKYLHFATHGNIDSFLPMESALILSRDNLPVNVAELKANEPYFDGRLTAKEVAQHWSLDADLVTLSACETGLGKHAVGEGYMGFAQSFLIRGSRSVVLSLWSVDDTATALLMKQFYENLIKKKMSKIDALREAKKWLRTLPRSEVLKLTAKMSNGVARGPGRKKLPPLSKVPIGDKEDAPYAHPYYWSAFILIGDPG